MKNNLQNNTPIEDKKLDWNIVQNVMKDKFGSDIFDSWLKKIELIDEYKNYVLISVSTRFIRDWITSRYLDQILQIVKSFKKDIVRIEFLVEDKKNIANKNNSQDKQNVKNNEIKLLNDEGVKSQYDWMIRRLEDAGYENYEFSNFSKPGFNSVNNSNYWSGKPYLGIGPSAHSFDGNRKRSWNVSNNVKYLKSIQQGNLPSSFEELSAHEAFNEYLMTALRTSRGVSLQKINETFGERFTSYLEKQVENHLISQRLFWDGDALKVSKTAKFLTDGIASDLFIIKS